VEETVVVGVEEEVEVVGVEDEVEVLGAEEEVEVVGVVAVVGEAIGCNVVGGTSVGWSKVVNGNICEMLTGWVVNVVFSYTFFWIVVVGVSSLSQTLLSFPSRQQESPTLMFG
jgi:hypothetical protein